VLIKFLAQPSVSNHWNDYRYNMSRPYMLRPAQFLYAQYTPPMRRNCFVASRRQCVHEFATCSWRLSTDSIDNLETGQTDSIAVSRTMWILIDTDNFFNSDDIITSLLKKLSIFIKISVIKRYGVCLVSFKIVDRIRRQSSWASCELCSHRRRRCDKTVSLRTFDSFVTSAVCIGLYSLDWKSSLEDISAVLFSVGSSEAWVDPGCILSGSRRAVFCAVFDSASSKTNATQ